MKIPLVDLQRQSRILHSSIETEINKIIRNGDFVLGEQVRKFESDFKNFITAKYCIGIASGTDGVLLSLLALGIDKDDEVIVPAFTFSATVSPALIIGVKPVLVDILPDSPFIDPRKIEIAITKKTKAIIPVHMYGAVCDMDEIMKISRKYKIAVIEDASQAHGSLYKKKNAGTFGKIGIFSFYPGKNLGAYGDAGAIVTDSGSLAEKLIMLRNHGQKHKYLHNILGINSRLDSIQAAVLSVKLKYLDRWNERRKKIAQIYSEQLKMLPIKLISYDDFVDSNYHLFVIRTNKRNKLVKYLESKKIYCGIHYPYPIHFNPAFKSLGKDGDYPFAEKLSQECLSLPLFPEMSDDEVLYVVESIRSFYNS